ncbi:hypothetical protein ACIPZ8_26520 [Pseudomonas sp. NPDC089422]|uniref:hypothetical protein n=1 Tax=Pseudomonas sp. NPDC089422 TaxID=3364466 RepID=UPI0037F59912
MKTATPTINFRMNESVQKIFDSSSAPLSKDCNSTLCMYQFDIPSSSPNKAKVTISSASASLIFDDVISAALSTYKSDQLNHAYITLGGVPSNARHEQAIDYFYTLLDKLHAAGWKRYILPDEARIPGTQADKFDDPDMVLGTPVSTGPWKDPALKLKKEEWLSLPMFSSWYFNKDDVYVLLRVQRENSSGEEKTLGSYLFTLTFRTESEFYKGFVDDEAREKWTTLLPAELKRMAQERAQTEARLKKMGIAIDEDYQDPPIKALE